MQELRTGSDTSIVTTPFASLSKVCTGSVTMGVNVSRYLFVLNISIDSLSLSLSIHLLLRRLKLSMCSGSVLATRVKCRIFLLEDECCFSC